MISILLAIRNETKNLFNFLNFLKKQSNQNFELIIVDYSDNCKSLNFIKNYNGIRNLKIFKLKNSFRIQNKRGAQVNQAFLQSKGNIVFFPDTDMYCSINLLDEIKKKMLFSKSMYIREKIMGKGMYGMVRNFERYFYTNTVIDAPRVLKRNLYKNIGGFDNSIDFGADDWDLAKKIKTKNIKSIVTKNVVYHNEMGLNFKEVLKKKKNYSNNFNRYINKWGKKDKDIKKQFGIYYRFFGIFIENRKKIFFLIKNLNLYFIFFLNKFLVGLFFLFRNGK